MLLFLGPTWFTFGKGEMSVTVTLCDDGFVGAEDGSVSAEDGSVGAEDGSTGADDGSTGTEDGSIGAHNGCSVASDGAKSSSEYTSGLNGEMPVVRNPLTAFSIVAHRM